MNSSFGARVIEARKLARLSQAQLAFAAGISQPTISRIESDAVSPTFEDICAIARITHAPLLFLATGYGQSGFDSAVLIAHLNAYGLHDMDVPPPAPLIGESRVLEELLSAAARLASPRILEAIPALLLRNEFSSKELLGYARKDLVSHRIGWLAEIALSISTKPGISAGIRPHASERLEEVRQSCWVRRRKYFKTRSPIASWDAVGRTLPAEGALRQLAEETPPIARKWRIAYATPEKAFFERTTGILRG